MFHLMMSCSTGTFAIPRCSRKPVIDPALSRRATARVSSKNFPRPCHGVFGACGVRKSRRADEAVLGSAVEPGTRHRAGRIDGERSRVRRVRNVEDGDFPVFGSQKTVARGVIVIISRGRA